MRVGLARRRQIAAEERVGQKYGKLILESLLPPEWEAWMSRFLAFQNNRRRLKLVG